MPRHRPLSTPTPVSRGRSGARAATPAARPDDDNLDALAVAAGQAWASTVLGELRSQDRQVSGGWPGVVREARARVVVALGRERPSLPEERLAALARTAYASARTLWSTQAEPDLEP